MTKIAEDIVLINLNTLKLKKTIETKVVFQGIDNLISALQSRKGVILLGAHMGSIIFGTLSVIKACLDSFSRPGRGIRICTEPDMIKYPGVLQTLQDTSDIYDADITFILTNRMSKKIIEDMHSALSAKNIITTNMDVMRGGLSRIEFSLFNKVKVYLPSIIGAVKMAFMAGAAVIPWFNIRNEKGNPIIWFEEPLFFKKREKTGMKDIIHYSRILCQKLEKWIMRHPEQWIYWDRFGKRITRGNMKK